MPSPFFNPYMKGPDIPGGIQQILQQLLPILLMKRMTAQPKAPQGPTMPGPQGPMQNIPPMQPGGMGMGPQGQAPPGAQGLDFSRPETMQKIMSILRMMGTGGF